LLAAFTGDDHIDDGARFAFAFTASRAIHTLRSHITLSHASVIAAPDNAAQSVATTATGILTEAVHVVFITFAAIALELVGGHLFGLRAKFHRHEREPP
jgi:hypothetical protein